MALESCLDSGSETDSRVGFTLLLRLVDSVTLKRRCHTRALCVTTCGLSQRDTVKERGQFKVVFSHPAGNGDSSKRSHRALN